MPRNSGMTLHDIYISTRSILLKLPPATKTRKNILICPDGFQSGVATFVFRAVLDLMDSPTALISPLVCMHCLFTAFAQVGVFLNNQRHAE